MIREESGEIECASYSALDVSVDNVVQALLSNEEEVQKFTELKEYLEQNTEMEEKVLHELKQEKSEIEVRLTRLKVRNATFQREQLALRNSITILRFKIEKIKESIEKAKATEIEVLDDFEKAVDELTEKFRCGPDKYNRNGILEKIKEERERKSKLTMALEKLTEEYGHFLQERGLKMERGMDEDLFNCILPDSPLFGVISITKILDQITHELYEIMRENKEGEGKIAVAKAKETPNACLI